MHFFWLPWGNINKKNLKVKTIIAKKHNYITVFKDLGNPFIKNHTFNKISIINNAMIFSDYASFDSKIINYVIFL